MGRSKIDRTGEKNINNFGSEMIIVEYRKWNDIDVYFPEYDWIAKRVRCNNFKNGKIKCPYERTVLGIGYVGEGEYKMSKNGRSTRVYDTWYNMLMRCYSEKTHKKQPTYIGCEADESFHNFQNFGDWDKENYYQVERERMCLDKDILLKGNKIYSPETCIYVPQTINTLFTKRQNDRGESVIGTSYHKRDKKYQAYCNLLNPETGKSKRSHLGYYDTELEAFEVYKYYKEKNIKEVADYFKEQIPSELYNELYNYIVEITD